MDDFDKADLDGDGEFDAIDMMILGDEDEDQQQPTGRTGCSIALLVISSSVGLSWWSVSRLCKSFCVTAIP